MIACMTNDVTPYYVQPEGYGESDEDEVQTVSYGYEQSTQLPTSEPI